MDKKSVQGENPAITSGCEDETETDETPELHPVNSKKVEFSSRRSIANHARPNHQGDFTFGEEEEELSQMLSLSMECNSGYMDNMINNDEDDWILPKEAFPLRHEIQDRSPPPEQFSNHSPDFNDDHQSITIDNQPCQLVITQIPKPKIWDPTPIVKDCLLFHANIRDIQTTVTMLYVLGDKRKGLNIELAVQEHWLLEYIDMLARFKLYEVTAQVIHPTF